MLLLLPLYGWVKDIKCNSILKGIIKTVHCCTLYPLLLWEESYLMDDIFLCEQSLSHSLIKMSHQCFLILFFFNKHQLLIWLINCWFSPLFRFLPYWTEIVQVKVGMFSISSWTCQKVLLLRDSPKILWSFMSAVEVEAH